MLKYRKSAHTSSSGKFIVAPISFEVLPQLKAARLLTDRILRRCVNVGKQIWFLTVPSGSSPFYLSRFEGPRHNEREHIFLCRFSFFFLLKIDEEKRNTLALVLLPVCQNRYVGNRQLIREGTRFLLVCLPPPLHCRLSTYPFWHHWTGHRRRLLEVKLRLTVNTSPCSSQTLLEENITSANPECVSPRIPGLNECTQGTCQEGNKITRSQNLIRACEGILVIFVINSYLRLLLIKDSFHYRK